MEKYIAKTFVMSEKTWERHVNPWSVYTRYLTLPLIVAIVWSRAWLGLWFLVPFVLGLIWLWVNPRVFPKPQSTKWWASKCVFGERVWLAREEIPIPKHHAVMAKWLAIFAGVSKVPLIYGLIKFDLQMTLFGLITINLFKSWFLDRMVWLYEEMKEHPKYCTWEY